MIREAVSGIFTFGKEVFITHRQNYLRAFPGYHAFPGGKVDKEDSLEGNQDEQKLFSEDVLLKKFPLRFMRALNREMKEELGIDIFEYCSYLNKGIQVIALSGDTSKETLEKCFKGRSALNF